MNGLCRAEIWNPNPYLKSKVERRQRKEAEVKYVFRVWAGRARESLCRVLGLGDKNEERGARGPHVRTHCPTLDFI